MILQISRVSFRAGNNLARVNSGLPCTLNIAKIANPNEAVWYQLKRNSSCIQSRQIRDRSVKKPAPWPYKEKKYTFLHGYIDNTVSRFDCNSRIIIIDGNIGAGKTALAKTLAEELEFEYFPEVKVEDSFKTETGFDKRSLDHMFPENVKSCDLEQFYKDPKALRAATFQFKMYALRYEQYIDALAHLLNTGNGIVMERSIYSDFVFMEAMVKEGYMSKLGKSFYNDVKQNTILEVLKPHLIIYLDVPVDICLERIRKRNLPHEQNSKVLTKEYLQEIEYQYKEHFLKEISLHTEVLSYDWSDFGDTEALIDDLEKLDFDKYDRYDLKLRDWRESDNTLWSSLRRKFTNHKSNILRYLLIPRMDVPELIMSGEEQLLLENIENMIPEISYSKGFNPFKDKGWLFKTKRSYWEDQKLRFY